MKPDKFPFQWFSSDLHTNFAYFWVSMWKNFQRYFKESHFNLSVFFALNVMKFMNILPKPMNLLNLNDFCEILCKIFKSLNFSNEFLNYSNDILNISNEKFRKITKILHKKQILGEISRSQFISVNIYCFCAEIRKLFKKIQKIFEYFTSKMVNIE